MAEGSRGKQNTPPQTTQSLFETCICPKPPPPPATGEEWMVTYADAITLLLAFFVILLSTATFDPAKFEALSDAMSEGGNPNVMDFQKLESVIELVAKAYENEQPVEVKKVPDGLVIELSSNSLFKSGSADILQENRGVLRSLASRISKLDYADYLVDVEGHTDDVPINTERFPSNWELSAQRAINVGKILMQHGIPANKIKPIAYAETRPLLPNIDPATGKGSKDNRARNRRIEIFIHRASVRDRMQLDPESVQHFDDLGANFAATPAKK